MSLKLYAPGTRKGNKTYVAYGWWAGKPVEKSLGTRDPEEAETKFLELQLALRKQKATAGELTYAEAEEAYRAAKQIVPGSPDDKRLAALRRVLGERVAATISGGDLRRAAIKLYPNHKASTRNREVVRPAAAVLHALADEHKIPWQRYKQFPEEATEPKPVTEGAAQLLAKNTERYKRLLMLFLFDHGWRISEALRIEWEHLDLTAGMLAHYNRKANEWSRLPIHPEVLDVLRNIPQGEREGHLFPWRTKSGVYKWLRPLTKQLGIKFTPHMARHSFATWLVDQGGDDHDLLATRNWTSLQSTRKYTKISKHRAQEALGKLKGIS